MHIILCPSEQIVRFGPQKTNYVYITDCHLSQLRIIAVCFIFFLFCDWFYTYFESMMRNLHHGLLNWHSLKKLDSCRWINLMMDAMEIASIKKNITYNRSIRSTFFFSFPIHRNFVIWNWSEPWTSLHYLSLTEQNDKMRNKSHFTCGIILIPMMIYKKEPI